MYSNAFSSSCILFLLFSYIWVSRKVNTFLDILHCFQFNTAQNIEEPFLNRAFALQRISLFHRVSKNFNAIVSNKRFILFAQHIRECQEVFLSFFNKATLTHTINKIVYFYFPKSLGDHFVIYFIFGTLHICGMST